MGSKYGERNWCQHNIKNDSVNYVFLLTWLRISDLLRVIHGRGGGGKAGSRSAHVLFRSTKSLMRIAGAKLTAADSIGYFSQ
jgi:hypothetical protein